MLGIRIQCNPVFSVEGDAIGPCAALARALTSVTRFGPLWTPLSGALVDFDATAIGRALERPPIIPEDDVRQPTHVLSVCVTPGKPREIGVACINVRPGTATGAAPGLAVTLTLSEPTFDTSPPALRRLLDACLDAVSPDLAIVGPRPWFRELRAGWATFTRTVHRDLLPAGAVVIPIHGGTLVLAHAEDPASESPAARDAVAQVRAAIDSRPPSQPTEPIPVVAPPPPVLVEQAPAYLPGSRHPLARTSLSFDAPHGPALPFAKSTGDQPPPAPSALPRVQKAPAHLTGTAYMPDSPIGPALPFAKSADGTLPLPPPRSPSPSSAGDHPAPVPTTLPPVLRAPAHLSGTMGVLDRPAAAVLPFVKSPPDEPPDLTLDAYAALRAKLTVKGEGDPGTWREFGIASHAMKEALQARFAARFRDDPAARDRFVALVQGMVSELRKTPAG